MPVVLRLGSISLRIYPMDHAPAHIHAVFGDAEAVIEIETGREVRSKGFNEKTLNRIKARVLMAREELMEEWNDYQN